MPEKKGGIAYTSTEEYLQIFANWAAQSRSFWGLKKQFFSFFFFLRGVELVTIFEELHRDYDFESVGNFSIKIVTLKVENLLDCYALI